MWKYEVLRKDVTYPHLAYEIHSVYSDGESEDFCMCSESPDTPYGETLTELRNDLNRMLQAVNVALDNEDKIRSESEFKEE